MIERKNERREEERINEHKKREEDDLQILTQQALSPSQTPHSSYTRSPKGVWAQS